MSVEARPKVAGILHRPPTDREVAADRIARRLDGPVSALGVVALVLWLLEPATTDNGLDWLVEGAWIFIWVTFIAEFVARAVVAPYTWQFLGRHCWEVAFLIVPFLRFARAVRLARSARGLSSAYRSSRSAGDRLRDRLLSMAFITAIFGGAAGRLLWEYGSTDYRHSYIDALHDAALATLKGDQLRARGGIAAGLEIVLALYSVVIVAALASTVGAYFVEHGLRQVRAPKLND